MFREALKFFSSLFVLVLSTGAHGDETPRIGMLLPLSGQFAAIGADNRAGIEIAMKELGQSHDLSLVFADSRSDPTLAATEFRKLVAQEKVHGVYVFRGPPGMAVNPISKNLKVPLLGGVGNQAFALNNEYAFQIWPRSDREGELLAEKIVANGNGKVALATVQDDWPVSVSEGFRKRITALGVRIVADEDVLPNDSEFKTLALKFQKQGAQAVFVNLGLSQIASFVRQLREIGYTGQIFTNFWAGKKEVIEGASHAMEGVFYLEMSTNFDYLKKEVQSRSSSALSGATLSAYVATILFAQAAEKITEVNSESLYQALLKQKEVRTKSGNFVIRDRFVEFPMSVRTIKDSKPQDFAQ